MGQLSALFYKNWIIYKRGLVGNIIEMMIPIICILFIALVRQLSPPVPYATQSFYNNPAYTFSIDSSNPQPPISSIFHVI
jgi:hypothetical protein